MRDDGVSVFAFVNHVRFRESRLRIAFAGHVGLARLSAPAFPAAHCHPQGAAARHIDAHGASGVARLIFRLGGDRHDFLAGQQNFFTRFHRRKNHDGFHTRHFFRGAGVNALDFCVRVRPQHHAAEQHALAMNVIGIRARPEALPARPREKFACQSARVVCCRPLIVGHYAFPPPCARPLPQQRGARPCMCRSGIDCRRALPSPLHMSASGAIEIGLARHHKSRGAKSALLRVVIHPAAETGCSSPSGGFLQWW